MESSPAQGRGFGTGTWGSFLPCGTVTQGGAAGACPAVRAGVLLRSVAGSARGVGRTDVGLRQPRLNLKASLCHAVSGT